MAAKGRGRTLGTARAALQVLRLLRERPRGVRVDEVAVVLGKSTWTARYVLNSLCQEGFARRDPSSGRYVWSDPVTGLGPERVIAGLLAPPEEPPAARRVGGSAVDLARARDALQELSVRTGQRAYLALVDGTQMAVADAVGRRGLPAIEGVHPALAGQAHALAIGKAILAHWGPAAVVGYAAVAGLRRFTPRTITDVAALLRELEAVRLSGCAYDLEEFQEGFCCVAAPLFEGQREIVGAIGVSVPARRFERERSEIREIVTQVAWWASASPADALATAVGRFRRNPEAGGPLRARDGGSRTLGSLGAGHEAPGGSGGWKEVRP